MNISKYPSKQALNGLLQRPSINQENLTEVVSEVLAKVKKGGDEQLLFYTQKFDQVALSSLEIGVEEKETAIASVPNKLKLAIRTAALNIEKFHERQREDFEPLEVMPGVRCWRKSVGIERVGLYIPGGTAPLFSTVLMLGIPAKLAGCQEVILCTPPRKDGTIHPAILFAAEVASISKIYKVGGAQAIAALAFGTESIPKVDKIFGPGNRYVTAAKVLVQQNGVAIDMPAGPSEVLVFADETCVPSFVAADLLSQAEHDVDSQVVFLTTNQAVLDEVMAELNKQSADLPRQKMIQGALSNSVAILLKDEKEAIAAINLYAPEHLILACNNAGMMADQIINAGSVFIGNYTPESAGDYASGTNHTLPTNGFARSFSGVSLDSFLKKITFQHITKKGLMNLGPTIITMANEEELPAHARAVELRMGAMNS